MGNIGYPLNLLSDKETNRLYASNVLLIVRIYYDLIIKVIVQYFDKEALTSFYFLSFHQEFIGYK